MQHKYNQAIDKLSIQLEITQKSLQKHYFVFINLDVNNLIHISLINNMPLSNIYEHIHKILEEYKSELLINEFFSIDPHIAFIVSKEMSPYDLNIKIKDIYTKLNSSSLEFIVARFKSKLISQEDNVTSLLIRSLKSSENHLYHIPLDKREQIDNSFRNIHILSKAINHKSLYFMFQPVFSCNGGNIAFYECLLRLSIEGKIFSTADLISAAEEYKYIAMIDELVLDMAIERLRSNKEISLSVNFSRSFIDNIYLIEKTISYFSSQDGQEIASRFIIEFTESLLNNSFNEAKSFIQKMQNLGARVALDDFGKGYTSFHQIKNLNFDIIKIDGAFIKDASENIDNRTFVESIVKIAQEIGALTVAEFVENGYTAKYLMDIGIDYMQGNYLSVPIENV